MLLLSSFFLFLTLSIFLMMGGEVCTEVKEENRTESQTVHPLLPAKYLANPLAHFGPCLSSALSSACSAEGSIMLSVWSSLTVTVCFLSAKLVCEY